MQKIERTTVYTTADGKNFDVYEEATRWQARIDFLNWAEKIGLCQGGDWTAPMVAEAILNDVLEVGRLLDSYRREAWSAGGPQALAHKPPLKED